MPRASTSIVLAGILACALCAPANAGGSPDAVYSNLGTFRNESFPPGGATQQLNNTITRMAADDLNLVGTPPYSVNGFRFTVSNLNSVDVSARVLVRFYLPDGPGGGPGTLVQASTYNAIVFTANRLGASIKTSTKFVLPSASIWASVGFDNNGGSTGATALQLNNLALGVFSPAEVGTSADRYFVTTNAGSFASDDPAGTITNFGGAPPADFGWEILTAQDVDLSITKTDGVATASPGGNLVYTITAGNAGPDTVFDARVVDTFPTSLTCSWTCAGSAGNTCAASGTGNIDDATVDLAVGGSVTYTATCAVSPAATGTVDNTATIFAPGTAVEARILDNSATDSDAIAPADLTLAKSHAAGFTRGQPGSYNLTVTNVGGSPTSGAVTVTDDVPIGLAPTAAAGSGWTCNVAAQAVSCSRGDSLAPGASYPPISLAVAVAANAPPTVTNTASVSTGGDTNPANDTAEDPTAIAAGPTTVTITSAQPDPTSVGTETAVTVAVATISGYPPPSGSVDVYLEGHSGSVCTITLPAPACSFFPTVSGHLTMTASYGGDGNYSSGVSAPFAITIAPVSSVVTLVSVTPNPSAVGTLTTVTATVDADPSLGAPTGTITVLDSNSNTLCTIPLPATSCGFAPTAPGTLVVLAQYGGDANYEAGSSSSLLLVVRAPATIAKVFAPLAIPLDGTTTLTFTLTNPNAFTPLTGVTFTDPFPAGLEVASPASANTGGCGSPTFAPAAGDIALTFSGGTVAAGGTCTVAVDVTGTTSGLKANVTGAVSSAEGGTGVTAAAFLVVVDPVTPAPPTIAKAFAPLAILVDGTTTLTFSLTNPNAIGTLNLVAFADAFPDGLAVAATPNATTSSGCGSPTFAPAAGATSVAFSGGVIAAGETCDVTVDVTATTGGLKANVTGDVTSTEGGAGGTASAGLLVIEPPAIAKVFGTTSLAVGATTTLTFTLTNPNAAIALTGVGFDDPLPGGLVVATPSGLTGACGGGNITADDGATSISLVGATLDVGASCELTVDVQALAVGPQVNTTNPVTSANGGTGNVATASITVVDPLPTIPTLSQWALAALAIGLMLIGLRRIQGT
jgi:uncharacterized repeat protein (TIGR01451 family)